MISNYTYIEGAWTYGTVAAESRLDSDSAASPTVIGCRSSGGEWLLIYGYGLCWSTNWSAW